MTPLSGYLEKLLLAKDDIFEAVQATRAELPFIRGAVPLVMVRGVGIIRQPEEWLSVLEQGESVLEVEKAAKAAGLLSDFHRSP